MQSRKTVVKVCNEEQQMKAEHIQTHQGHAFRFTLDVQSFLPGGCYGDFSALPNLLIL